MQCRHEGSRRPFVVGVVGTWLVGLLVLVGWTSLGSANPALDPELPGVRSEASAGEVAAVIYDLGQSVECGETSLGFSIDPTFDENTAADQVRLGSVDEAVIGSCVNPITGPVTVTLASPATVIGLNGLAGGAGQASVQDVELHVAFPGCAFTIAGSMEVEINFVAQSITSDDAPTQLFTTEVVGCFSQVAEGHEVRVIGTFSMLEEA